MFSLGVGAFAMLSGEQPVPGSNVTGILYKLVHADPIEPSNLEMNGLVPQKWHEVFSRALAKKPDDRYQSATDFVQDLEYCLGAWFGSAMGEETISERPDTGATVALPPVAAAAGARDIDDTPVPLPGPPPGAPPPAMPKAVRAAAAKTLPPVPLAKPAEDDPSTIVIKAQRPAAPAPVSEEDSSTVILKARPAPAPPVSKPDEGDASTVHMKAP